VDKAIVTVMLIVGGVVTSLAVFNGMYPAISTSSGAVTSATSQVSDRIESRIDIIQVADNSTQVEAWIKNTGTTRILSVTRCDVFYGPEGDFARIPYGSGSPSYWTYQLEGGETEWGPAVTLRLTIHLSSPISTGTYIFKVVLPNGISDSTTFGVD